MPTNVSGVIPFSSAQLSVQSLHLLSFIITWANGGEGSEIRSIDDIAYRPEGLVWSNHDANARLFVDSMSILILQSFANLPSPDTAFSR